MSQTADMSQDGGNTGLVEAARTNRAGDGPDVAELVQWGRDLHGQGRYEEAARLYQLILQVEPGSWAATVGRNRALRRSVPRWHWEMLHDHERGELYEQAIKEIVAPDRLVLDIGTGSGLLAMMAARAGTRQIVAAEGEPSVADVATRIIAKAGLADAITVVPKFSTRMTVPEDLPRRADVLVTETVDCGLLGEGILPTVAHAREHLLTDDAIILPARGRILAQLVESASLHRMNYVGELYGFDLSEFNRLSSIEYFDSRLDRHEHRTLSEPLEVFSFDFRVDGPEPRRAEFVVPTTAAGTCHAVVFWFELDLVPGVTLSNAPSVEASHWKQAVQCLPVPVEVRSGEPLLLDARHDGVSIHFSAVASGVRTTGEGQAV